MNRLKQSAELNWDDVENVVKPMNLQNTTKGVDKSEKKRNKSYSSKVFQYAKGDISFFGDFTSMVSEAREKKENEPSL